MARSHAARQLPTQSCLLHALYCRYLDPITLARAACVSREWRDAACADALWQPHCACILGAARSPTAAGPVAGSTGAPGVSSSSCRQLFAAAAGQHPQRLLRWRTNRVVLVGGRLGWLAEGRRPQGSQCRHVSTAAVLAFLKSGGRRVGHAPTSGSSGEDSGSGGEAKADLSSRLKFWQLG